MSRSNFTERSLKIIDQLKESLKNKERGERYSFCLVESVIRACDELYQYCLLYMDPALCHEMVIFLQSIAYDFVALNEWFKLKTVCKDLPPPVRTSVSPSRVSHHLKKLSRSHSFRRAKSEPRLNKPQSTAKEENHKNIQKSAGVNVSAPDFVPSYSSEQGVECSWNCGISESDRNSFSNQTSQSNIEPKSEFQNHFYTNVSDYHDDRGLNTNLVNLSYSQNIIPPNYWQYSTQINLNPFHHPTIQLPHHYVPHVSHIHLPYSLYTNSIGAGNIYPVGPMGNIVTEQVQCSVNSGLNHTFTYSTNDTSLQPLDISKTEESEDIRPSTSFSDNSDIVIICEKTPNVSYENKNAENNDLHSNPETNIKPDLEKRSLLSSDITEKLYIVNDGINAQQGTSVETSNTSNENITNVEPLPPDKNLHKSSMIVDSTLTEQIEVSQTKRIFGLGEDECQIHFPELKPFYSQARQKIRHKNSSKIKPNKPPFEISYSVNNKSNESRNKIMSESIIEEKGTFSNLFKSAPITEKQPIRTLTNTNRRKTKNTNSQISLVVLKQNQKIVKEMNEKVNTHISNSADDENNDSDGWETVKVRSKWRDQTDFKQSNRIYKSFQSNSSILSKQHGIRQNGKVYDSKLFQNNNSNISNVLRSSAVDYSEGIIKSYSSDEEPVTTVIEDKTSKLKQKHFHGGDTIEKNLYVEKCIKKGRRHSSNYAHKIHDNSETRQIDCDSSVVKTEKIDPNEMYSAYMQYINNVDEENLDAESKHDKSILHPDAGEEIPQSVASLEEITDFVNRDPIRALEFQKKLADEIKHQEDVKRKNEEKQQLAQMKRLQFLQCKTAKVREFVQKVEEVKAAQHQLALQRKSRIDLKLKKAEENRNMHLNIIKRKAHDEEEKLKEIAFINELEAQNRRHDSLALRQEHEERLQCLVEERQRRLEEKAAREAAVEERRRVLEAERQEKLEKMKEKRRRKQEIIDRKQQEREQERLEIAREKAREREERLQARQSAQLATVEELQKRIQQKQEQSARRHVECIELIRQKAVEIGLHRNTFDNVPNYINVYKAEDQFKTEFSDKDTGNKNKQKVHQKKRYKKIKSRMTHRGTVFIESLDLTEIVFTGKDLLLEKLLRKLQSYTPHPIYLWQDEQCLIIDHCLNEIFLILQSEPMLQNSFKLMKGYTLINSIIQVFNKCSHDKLSSFSLKCIIKIINLWQVTCVDNRENCCYLVFSNMITTLLDSLKLSIKIMGSSNKSWEVLVEALLKLDSTTLESFNELTDDDKNISDLSLRMKDLISYIIYSGLITVIVNLFRASEIDEKYTHSSLILPCIRFFGNLLSVKFKTDEFMNILKTTDLLGTVPFLYEGLMQHITEDGSLPEYSLPIINLFLKLAHLDLNSFQDILGSEGIALQWRGIASGLMTVCVRKEIFGELLHGVIKTVGYFAVKNKKNQTLIQSGKHPTVLQQLVKLPFKYFCDPQYIELLFPTLIACSFQNATNRAIVENELNYSVLEKFINSAAGKRNELITFLFQHQNDNI